MNKTRLAGAVLAAFGLIAGAAATNVQAAQPSATYKIEAFSSQATRYAATNGIAPNAGKICGDPVIRTNTVIRTFDCESVAFRFIVYRIVDGEFIVEGTATFTVQDEMRLNIDGLTWTEDINVSPPTLTGSGAQGISLTFFELTSGAAATTSGDLAHPFPLVSGKSESGTVTYTTRVAKMQQVPVSTMHQFGAEKPGYGAGVSRWEPESVRCDDAFWSANGGRHLKRAGCVFPTHAPVDGLNGISAQAFIPWVDQNTRAGQAGPHHFGKPGGAPLHRITDESTINANRNAACGKFPPQKDYGWVVIPAPPGKTNFTTPSCDEYPYASTQEGGNKYPADQKLKWVPLGFNRLQGQALNAFYRETRVLDGDPYYINMT